MENYPFHPFYPFLSKALIFISCCDLSLDSSQGDGSNKGPQHMFLWKNKKNYP